MSPNRAENGSEEELPRTPRQATELGVRHIVALMVFIFAQLAVLIFLDFLILITN